MRRLTRIEAVIDEVRTRIASRNYPPGTRLPSVRAQARAMAVSVSTVITAYERLQALELIRARPGSGYYVTAPMAPLTLAALAPQRDRQIDPLWLSRQSLQADPTLLRPGCGWLPADWMYEHGMRRALRASARAETSRLTDYADSRGLAALRQVLARRLVNTGVIAAPEQIVLTDSGTQALDLICRFLLEPGDRVLVDDPCYFNFQALLQAHRAVPIGIPFGADGPDLDAFQRALQTHSPRLYLTNSALHNPTGASLSATTAHRLLSLAERSDLVIVEDEIFADFEIRPAPRLAAGDGLHRVIQIGSFSKTISAALRCGYIAARADWIEALIDLKTATSFSASQLGAAVLYDTLTDSGYRRHLQTLHTRLAQARQTTSQRLQRLGIEPWRQPDAGMFLWCRLPHGIDAAALARASLQRGMILAPGNAFSPSLSAGDYLRFNVAQCGSAQIFETLEALLSAAEPT